MTKFKKSSYPRKKSLASARSSRLRSEAHVMGLRSPSSTRSIIDPSASPSSTARSFSPDASEHSRRDLDRQSTAPPYLQRESAGVVRAERHLERALSRSQRQRTWTSGSKGKGNRTCFPNIRDPKTRRKVLGTIISGVILVIMLSICKLELHFFKSYD